MSTTESKAVVQRMCAVTGDGGDPAALAAFYAPGFVYHNAMLPEPTSTPDPGLMAQLVLAARAAFPDMRYSVEALVAEEERVALLYSWTGTNRGPFGALPPTGRTVTARGAIYCRVVDGKIVEQWDQDDRFAVIQQLGLTPDVT